MGRTVLLLCFMIQTLCLALGAGGCTSEEKLLELPYRQDFSGGTLGPEWSSRTAGWSVVDGRLFNDGAHNVPLWLGARLPRDVRVSFVAESRSPAVDLKFEIFGDGTRHESGYVVILSGWNNTKSIIARLDEHGPERSAARTEALRVEVAADPRGAASRYRGAREIIARPHRGSMGHPYRFEFLRRGHELQFSVDGVPHLTFYDPAPLHGSGHDRFAFNNWQSNAWFDDLVIEAL